LYTLLFRFLPTPEPDATSPAFLVDLHIRELQHFWLL